SFHSLSVITKDSLNFAEAIYDYLKSQSITFIGLNIEETEGENRDSSLVDNFDRVREFFKKFYTLSQRDGITVREFQNAKMAIASWSPIRFWTRSQGQETTPFRILNVDYQGNF